MNFFNRPFSTYAQRFYIYEYEKLMILDSNPNAFESHITKISHLHDLDWIDVYDVIQMYGLLWTPQMRFQVETYRCDDIDLHHKYNPNFDKRWDHFKRCYPVGDVKLPSLPELIITNTPPDNTCEKTKLFKKGKREALREAVREYDQMWDETKLYRLQKKHGKGQIDILDCFEYVPPKWR